MNRLALDIATLLGGLAALWFFTERLSAFARPITSSAESLLIATCASFGFALPFEAYCLSPISLIYVGWPVIYVGALFVKLWGERFPRTAGALVPLSMFATVWSLVAAVIIAICLTHQLLSLHTAILSTSAFGGLL